MDACILPPQLNAMQLCFLIPLSFSPPTRGAVGTRTRIAPAQAQAHDALMCYAVQPAQAPSSSSGSDSANTGIIAGTTIAGIAVAAIIGEPDQLVEPDAILFSSH